MNLSLSHWYYGSGVVLDLSIPDLCTITYFLEVPESSEMLHYAEHDGTSFKP